jgi:DNA mismatch repair ATPase MutS
MFSDHVDAPLEIARGRLMPLEGECAAASLVYTPLDLDLPERATIIFGSNMGGKTVVLETVLFLQILAQAGFHVPASRYSTRCYPLIHYVGEGGTLQSTGGLSGFGREIRSLVECSEWSGRGALMAFDEFARSTSSLEAEAILSAALEELAASTGRRSLFSSHFRGIARIGTERIGTVPIGAVSIGTVRHLRMRGLDRKAATSALAAASKPEGLASLAGRINRMMNYELVEDEGGPESSDAILIAGLLGLDPRLVARAEAHYARKRAKDGKRQG